MIIGFLEGVFGFLVIASIPIAVLIWILRGIIQKYYDWQRTKSQIIASALVVLISLPSAYFIDGMAMDSPTSTEVYFWKILPNRTYTDFMSSTGINLADHAI